MAEIPPIRCKTQNNQSINLCYAFFLNLKGVGRGGGTVHGINMAHFGLEIQKITWPFNVKLRPFTPPHNVKIAAENDNCAGQ